MILGFEVGSIVGFKFGLADGLQLGILEVGQIVTTSDGSDEVLII